MMGNSRHYAMACVFVCVSPLSRIDIHMLITCGLVQVSLMCHSDKLREGACEACKHLSAEHHPRSGLSEHRVST